MNTQQWVSQLFSTIDKKDSSGFKTFLAEDCIFRFGNMPPVTGSEAIGEAVHQFFQSLKSITHEIDGVIEEG
ncbi:MAG: nuclear transport factor 2 family protein, partial [Candidatus Methylumidiphilus sp.]